MTRQRRLARSVRAENSEEFALSDGERDIIKCPMNVLFPRMEHMRKMLDTNELPHTDCLLCGAQAKISQRAASIPRKNTANKTPPLYPISIVNTNEISG